MMYVYVAAARESEIKLQAIVTSLTSVYQRYAQIWFLFQDDSLVYDVFRTYVVISWIKLL